MRRHVQTMRSALRDDERRSWRVDKGTGYEAMAFGLRGWRTRRSQTATPSRTTARPSATGGFSSHAGPRGARGLASFLKDCVISAGKRHEIFGTVFRSADSPKEHGPCLFSLSRYPSRSSRSWIPSHFAALAPGKGPRRFIHCYPLTVNDLRRQQVPFAVRLVSGHVDLGGFNIEP